MLVAFGETWSPAGERMAFEVRSLQLESPRVILNHSRCGTEDNALARRFACKSVSLVQASTTSFYIAYEIDIRA